MTSDVTPMEISLATPDSGAPLEPSLGVVRSYSEIVCSILRKKDRKRPPVPLLTEMKNGSLHFSIKYVCDDSEAALTQALMLLMEIKGARGRLGLISACAKETTRQFLNPQHRRLLADPVVRKNLRNLYYYLSELNLKKIQVNFGGSIYICEIDTRSFETFTTMFKRPPNGSNIFTATLEVIDYDRAESYIAVSFFGVQYRFNLAETEYNTFFRSMETEQIVGAALKCELRQRFGRIGSGTETIHLVDILGWAPFPDYDIRPIPRGIRADVATPEPV